MMSTQETLQTVIDYVAAFEAAQKSGADSDFERVRSLLADDVVVRAAGSGDGSSTWREGPRDADFWIGRQKARARSGSPPEEETVNVFASGDQAVVEQIERTPHGSRPLCFILRVRDGRVAEISAYRNDAAS